MELERGHLVLTFIEPVVENHRFHLDRKNVFFGEAQTFYLGQDRPGLHYQVAPMGEVKFIRCIKGSVFDVLVDMRPESATYRKWFGLELSAENQVAIYIPEGFAHGHQTLEDDSQIMYLTSQVYSPEHERGVRWNDPAIGVEWPLEPTVVSDKDQSWSLI